MISNPVPTGIATRRAATRPGRGRVPLIRVYLDGERPGEPNPERVFVVLKGRRRGSPLTPAGLDQVVDGARARAGIPHLTCHQLRHTCMTRLREAGMPLEAVQAQAGHRSIESTRIYLHLAGSWVSDEYAKAVAAIDADLAGVLE